MIWKSENIYLYLHVVAYYITSWKDTRVQPIFISLFSTDPHHRPRYLQGNSFLAMLNGDRPHNDMKGSGMHYCHYVLYVCGRAVEICIVERKSCISPFHLLSMERKLPAYQEACADWRTRWWRHHTVAVQVSSKFYTFLICHILKVQCSKIELLHVSPF